MGPDDATYVEFEGVSKTYDGVTPVVEGLDLQVRKGEFLTLLGPSGSGKTTCLMMLAGFEAPTAGSIRIRGRPIGDLPPRKRGIGMVFQNYALFPHLSVGQNLAFPLEVRGVDPEDTRKRVARALGLVRLEGYEDRKTTQLSGGQQQRVAIARALVFEPDLVLMDEPLGALDRRLREEMQYEIRRIQRTLGITCIYVTHDQQEAMVLSDRVAVFHDGRLQQIATPEGLYEEPMRNFVARFIGENNRLCRTDREDRRRRLRRAGRGRRDPGPAGGAGGGRGPDDALHPARAGRAGPRAGPLRQRVRGARRGPDLPRRPPAGGGQRARDGRLHRQDPEHRGPRRRDRRRPGPHRLDPHRLPGARPRARSGGTVSDAQPGAPRFLVALGLMAGAACAADPPGGSLTAVSWGGSYARAINKAYYEPFEAATGVVIGRDDLVDGGLAPIRTQVDIGKVHWDVLSLESSQAIRACDEGLLEVIPRNILLPGADGSPASEDFSPGTLTECGVGHVVYSTIYAYHPDRFPDEKPGTIADFFDLERFPGRRGMRRSPIGNLEFALLADGVRPEEVYTLLDTAEGIRRVFRKLDTLRDHVVWWEAGAQPPQMLADAEVVMTTAYNGRIFNAQVLENQPFVIVWDGQLLDTSQIVVVAGLRTEPMRLTTFDSPPPRNPWLGSPVISPTRRRADRRCRSCPPTSRPVFPWRLTCPPARKTCAARCRPT